MTTAPSLRESDRAPLARAMAWLDGVAPPARVGAGALWLLRVSAACLFIGRAWQHLRWHSPVWAFAWHQRTFEPIVGAFGYSYHEYSTSPAVESVILGVARGLGVLFACAAAAVIVPVETRAARRLRFWVLIAAGLAMAALAYCYYLDNKYALGQLVEHSIQVVTPFAVALLLRRTENVESTASDSESAESSAAGGTVTMGRPLEVALRLAVAGTFVGHGLYALGYYEVPGNFIEMTQRSLGVSRDATFGILAAAGWLDMLVAAGVVTGFVLRPVDRLVLPYAMFWGTVTAVARTWSVLGLPFLGDNLAQSVHLTIYRLPHGAVPLFLLLSLGLVRFPKAAPRIALSIVSGVKLP